MRMSTIIGRSMTVILLCIMLQACSKEQAVEKDLHQQSGNEQSSIVVNEAGTAVGAHEQNTADSSNEEHKVDEVNASINEDAGSNGDIASNEDSTSNENTVSDSSAATEPSEPAIPPKAYELPDGFVYLEDVLPNVQYEIRYYSDYNFVGQQIEGYKAPYAIATEEMAEALVKVSNEMEAAGYRLLIYDTYRPTKAVEFFKEWSTDEDTTMKDIFYPNEDKSQLFKRGYLSKKSGHSRGSTVDLTLVEADSGELVDMGSPYDLLDEISYFGTSLITTEQADNRELLKQVMKKYGFKEYSKEWWHYVLNHEPYPTTYFDFDVQ